MNYHNPGFPSAMAQQYFTQLQEAGWDKKSIERLELKIPIFGSLSICGSFESCCLAFINLQDAVVHETFLRKLHGHIKRICQAESDANLHVIACGKGTNAMAAQRMLQQKKKKARAAE